MGKKTPLHPLPKKILLSTTTLALGSERTLDLWDFQRESLHTANLFTCLVFYFNTSIFALKQNTHEHCENADAVELTHKHDGLLLRCIKFDSAMLLSQMFSLHGFIIHVDSQNHNQFFWFLLVSRQIKNSLCPSSKQLFLLFIDVPSESNMSLQQIHFNCFDMEIITVFQM